MATLTDSQLIVQAQQIKTEQDPLDNTAVRVGTMFEELVNNKVNNDKIETSSLSSSTSKIPSSATVKAYVDNATTGLLDDRGNYNAGGNTFPASGGSGTAGAIKKGDIWFISTAGILGGNSVSVGASVRALVDSPGQTAANWSILSNGVGYTPENVANKSTDMAADAGSTIKYPTVAAVETHLAGIVGSAPVTVKTSITSAELKSLAFPFKTLAASPGTGKARIPVAFLFKYNAGTSSYIIPGNSTFFVYVCYTRPGGQTMAMGGTAILSQNVADTANFRPFEIFQPTGNTGLFGVTDAAITLANFSANMITGDGTLDVYTTYYDIAL